MKKNQLRKVDQEKMRWKTMIAVKRRADCQAWNLQGCQSLFRKESHWGRDAPDKVAVTLEYKEHDSAQGRQRQVGKTCLVVEPQA